MKPEKISDAVGKIDDTMLAEADSARVKRKKRKNFKRTASVAASLAVVILGGALITLMPSSADAAAVALPQYPTIAPYPNPELVYTNDRLLTAQYEEQEDAWRESREAVRPEKGYGAGLEGYFSSTIGEFLSDTGSENRVFSPLSLYMALSMVAETTDGVSRKQILDLIGAEDIESLRTQANAVWRGSYSNDGATTSIMANSLWFDNRFDYNPATVGTIADSYYAGVYRGDMGSDALNEAMRNWLNEQTGGLLDDSVRSVEINDPNTIMTLFSTVYYRAKWDSEFKEDLTEDGIFHSPRGDVPAEFMYKYMEGDYYWSENFAAIQLELENSGCMWLVLPDEDVTMDELLADEKMYELILSEYGYVYLSKEEWEDRQRIMIHLRLPKFDISSDYSLIDGLRELGVTDIFSSSEADFSPLAEDMAEVRETYGGNITMGDAKQAARVAIDEEGVTAAAYTEMRFYGAAPPPEDEVEFTLDRPFFLALSHDAGMPLFTGVVNEP